MKYPLLPSSRERGGVAGGRGREVRAIYTRHTEFDGFVIAWGGAEDARTAAARCTTSGHLQQEEGFLVRL